MTLDTPQEFPELARREVQLCISSPMVNEPEPEFLTRTKLDFDLIMTGESFFVPFELIHEPTLRVKISRENSKPNGKRFKLMKHGPPAAAYELACVGDMSGPNVGKRRPTRAHDASYPNGVSIAPTPTPAPVWLPPVDDDA